MERPSTQSNLVIEHDEFAEQVDMLLKITRLPPLGSLNRRCRNTGRGPKKKAMPAKRCSPGVTAYVVPTGSKRGRRTAEAASWNFVPIDLDAVPLGIDETLAIIEEALPGRHVSWTTWSAKDGYASVRVFIALPGSGATVGGGGPPGEGPR